MPPLGETGLAYIIHRADGPGAPYWNEGRRFFPEVARWLDDPKDDGAYRFFLAVDGAGTILGGAVLDEAPIWFGPLKERKAGVLEDIEVDPAHRRQGVGAALLREVLAYAWERGAEYVRWTVDYDNAAGIALYDALGCAFVPEEDPSAEGEPVRYYTVVAVNPARTQQTEACNA